MDAELKILLGLTRSFPRIRGFGRLAGLFARFYNRKQREEVLARVLGHEMLLNPKECVDRVLLFCPQSYEASVVRCLQRYLRPGSTFLDAGAHIGFYSLLAADLLGHAGRILAVEADPTNFRRLSFNVQLSALRRTTIIRNVGLSDKSEVLPLALNLTGNRGAHSFLTTGDATVMVTCRPLRELLEEHDFKRLDVAKFDIEGFEYRVLREFLASAPTRLVPRTIVLEQNARHLNLGAGDALHLLQQNGFSVTRIREQNYLALRPSAGTRS